MRALRTAQCLLLLHEWTRVLSRAGLLDTSGRFRQEGLVATHTSNVGARNESTNEGRKSSGSGKVTRAKQYSHFQGQ